MNNKDYSELKLKDINDGDNLSILFGIPPTQANFTVFKRKDKLMARCHNAKPNIISVDELLREYDVVRIN